MKYFNVFYTSENGTFFRTSVKAKTKEEATKEVQNQKPKAVISSCFEY